MPDVAEKPAYAAEEVKTEEVVVPAVLPMRAKLVVTEVSKNASGNSTVTLSAAYDHTIASDRQLVPGPNPKGVLEIVVSNEFAARVVHGQAFYLVSA